MDDFDTAILFRYVINKSEYENNQSDYSNYGDTLITIVKEHLNSNSNRLIVNRFRGLR